MIRLESVLESWKTVRQDTAQAVLDFPAGELDFKPAPDLMSFREIARHILDAGNGLTGLLLDGETDFTAAGFRDRMKAHFSTLPAGADAAALAAELNASVERRTADLAQQTPEFFARIITRFDGQQVTRLELVQMVKEHELTHRSQLFVYQRLKGIVPVTTRRRKAAQSSR